MGGSNDVRTIVLVGKTGNGKSATGNSILGKKAFVSKTNPAGVTRTCELQTTITNGQVINVIDTPGLYDSSVSPDIICKEIVNCVNLVKDGVHAIMIVFSIRNRFSTEEVAAIRKLQSFFGERITDYMIIVFTGGDEFDEEDSHESEDKSREAFKDYLSQGFPETFQEICRLCRNRVVLFDNRTKNETKRTEQVKRLFFFVDLVIADNGGHPYSDELMERARELRQQQEFGSSEEDSKNGVLELKEYINKSYEEQYQRMTEMVESKLWETNKKLEQQLAEEQAARLKSDDEIRDLKERLQEAKKGTQKQRLQEAQMVNNIRELRERLQEAEAMRDTDEIREMRKGLQEAEAKRHAEIRELRQQLQEAEAESKNVEICEIRQRLEEAEANSEGDEIREMREKLQEAEAKREIEIHELRERLQAALANRETDEMREMRERLEQAEAKMQDEIRFLREKLEEAIKQNAELRNQHKCSIL